MLKLLNISFYIWFLLCAFVLTEAATGISPFRTPFAIKSSINQRPAMSIKITANHVSNFVEGTENSILQESVSSSWSLRKNVAKNLLGLWGVVQVVSVMVNAVKRLIPIALRPFKQNDLQPFHWLLYFVWCMVMGYTEGYKAFQLKFAPMVVSRAFDLINKPSFLNYLLAGPYSMGMFNASRKRMVVSWLVMGGVFSLVKIVKFLPYPYRSIIDGGVVIGLSYGTLSIIALSCKALFGGKVMDPADHTKKS